MNNNITLNLSQNAEAVCENLSTAMTVFVFQAL